MRTSTRSGYGSPNLLGLFPVLAAVLLVIRHRHAEAFLRLTAMFFTPFPLVVLLPILLGLAAEPLPEWVVPVAGLALGYPEAKEPLSARLSLSATVHTDGYDKAAVEAELDAYDQRRGKDWSGDKVKQYSRVMRADFGAFVSGKRFRLV